MTWHTPEMKQYAKLEDLIDQNKPLTETFRPWPFWYFIREDRWPDLLRLLGITYIADTNWPYWVDFEGALIYRVPHHFLRNIEPMECFESEQSIFVPDDVTVQRPLLPQEEYEDAIYIRDGLVTVYSPGFQRPAGDQPRPQ